MDWMQRALSVCREKGISQAKLARAIGVEPARITEWKNGKREPYARQTYAVAEYLGVSLDWLMAGFGERSPRRESDLTDLEKAVLALVRERNYPADEIVRRLMAAP